MAKKRIAEEDDPALAVACPACRAEAGAKCRNYRGQNKQTCGTRIYANIRAEATGATEQQQGYLFPPDAPGAGGGGSENGQGR